MGELQEKRQFLSCQGYTHPQSGDGPGGSWTNPERRGHRWIPDIEPRNSFFLISLYNPYNKIFLFNGQITL